MSAAVHGINVGILVRNANDLNCEVAIFLKIAAFFAEDRETARRVKFELGNRDAERIYASYQ